jgi:hypothetical protein
MWQDANEQLHLKAVRHVYDWEFNSRSALVGLSPSVEVDILLQCPGFFKVLLA